MWGFAQKDYDIAKSKETTRSECARICNGNAECIGFEYNPSTKDCYLTKTGWRTFSPTGLSNWWSCEKKDGKRKFNLMFHSIFILNIVLFQFPLEIWLKFEWLKVTSTKVAIKKVHTFFLVCTQGYQCQDGKYQAGSIIQNTYEYSSNQCAKRCCHHVFCSGYYWERNTRYCSLTKATGQQMHDSVKYQQCFKDLGMFLKFLVKVTFTLLNKFKFRQPLLKINSSQIFWNWLGLKLF